ncbi:biotin transporter BioY [uncultured Leuconostoc sp.]|uniref:biotin transporter BioY n=1 Tax=uncultured Leuconostoc sp. TaxID=173262 RepID=UPI0025E569CA|nr:biotin transporter BioY [uncultured Leuconostoc sp.]
MKTQKLTLTVAIVALLIVMAYVPTIPLGIVPITIQNIGIMLAGTLLGWRNGLLAIIAWLFLAVIGLPVLTGGTGGFPVFFSATAGYLWAYPVAALLIGLTISYLDHLNYTNFVTMFVAILIFGVIFIDISGAFGLHFVTHMPLPKALIFQLAFIPGDIIKAIVATIITLALRRRFSILNHA